MILLLDVRSIYDRSGIKACSHCAIVTAIPLITTNMLHRTQWRCSYYATATTSSVPMQPIVSKNKSHSQIVLCEWVFNQHGQCIGLRDTT